jgi:hypothetical protein
MTPLGLGEGLSKTNSQWDPHEIGVCRGNDIMIAQSQSPSPVHLHENKMVSSSHLRMR